MADFTSEFWNYYVALISLVSMAGCGVFLWLQSRKRVAVPSGGTTETTGHVWDENLSELNSPMPRWWIWMFYITVIFSLVYAFLYPTLGSYAGYLGWKSTGAYQEELQKAEAEYGPLFAKYQQQDLKVVAADPQAHVMGERLFLTYCAQCHGSDARGGKGYPNLTDRDWLYGGDPEVIKTTLMAGRNGIMPPQGEALGPDVVNVAHYVLSLSASAAADPIKVALGKPKFAVCAACHGPEGTGNPALGAPNLTDKIWLYGGSLETIMETISKGRNNVMPAHKDFLGEGKVHVLAAYVWSLSNGAPQK
jgi:cytochrome c oxidase cbb3-type subunit III